MKKLVTMFLAAVFLLVTFVPVSAADWNLYGSARVTTFWTDFDGDTTQLNHALQGNSRFGGNVSHGAVKGGFEYGTGVNVRLLYGIVDLGFGEFLVGQHYAPLAAGSFLSSQVYNSDNNLLQFVAYTNPGGRPAMGQLSVNGLKIALIQPMEFEDPEVMLPQLQASYDLKLDGVALNFGGGFQTYDIDGGDGDSLTSYMGAFNAKLTMMDPLYINFGGFYGQNVGNIGQSGFNFPDAGIDMRGRAIVNAPDDIEDIDTFAGVFVLGAKLDTIGVEAGAGYRVNDNDEWDDEQKVLALYLQATVPLSADGRAFIVPEVGMIDYEWGDLEYDETYFGLKWQVNF